jgi:CBS-domain-containing membrane protein
MVTVDKSLLALTAAELMSGDLILIPEDTPLRGVAHLLLRNQISGAPVVDSKGKLIGVISSTDFIRAVAERRESAPESTERPVSCMFQTKTRGPKGEEVVHCTLAPGACSIQRRSFDEHGNEQIVCSEPHGIFADWQNVLVELLPADAVKKFMTADVVTVSPSAPVQELARKIVDARVHRVVVVDEMRMPLGIVTTTDIVAALARASESA